MQGLLWAILAGAAMSFQGVMNTKLSEKAGLLEANLFVQGTAFVLSLIAVLIAGGMEKSSGGLAALRQSEWYCRLGGILGLIITVTVMLAVKNLSVSIAVPAILIAQLMAAALIDAFGWLGQEQSPLRWNQLAGAALMIAGVLLFKWKK